MPDSFANGAVAADMARVFEPLAGRTMPTATAYGDTSTVSSAGLKRRLVTFAAPALVIIAAVGLLIAFVASGGPKERAPAASDLSQTTARQNTAARQASAEASTLSDQSPVRADREDDSLTDGGDGNARTPSPRPGPSVAPSPERLMATPRLNAAEKSRADPDPSPPRSGGAVQKVLDRRDGFANLPRCTPGSTEDRCIYQDVLNADAKLRTAFDNARRAGVSNAQLSTIRARWNNARRDADDDPDGTIWRYNQLAAALDRMPRSDPE